MIATESMILTTGQEETLSSNTRSVVLVVKSLAPQVNGIQLQTSHDGIDWFPLHVPQYNNTQAPIDLYLSFADDSENLLQKVRVRGIDANGADVGDATAAGVGYVKLFFGRVK